MPFDPRRELETGLLDKIRNRLPPFPLERYELWQRPTSQDAEELDAYKRLWDEFGDKPFSAINMMALLTFAGWSPLDVQRTMLSMLNKKIINRLSER